MGIRVLLATAFLMSPRWCPSVFVKCESIMGAGAYQEHIKSYTHPACSISPPPKSPGTVPLTDPLSPPQFDMGDLDDILKELLPSISKGIFVHLTNFAGAALKSTSFPVILRRPTPVTLRRFRTAPEYEGQAMGDFHKGMWGNWYEKREWIVNPAPQDPSPLGNSTGSPWDTVTSCGLSRWLSNAGAVFDVGKCTHLDFYHFASAIKPWNVQVKLHVFPPCTLLFPFDREYCGCEDTAEREWGYPHLWFQEVYNFDTEKAKKDQTWRYAHSFPSTQPVFNAIIVSNDRYFQLLEAHAFELVSTVFEEPMDMVGLENTLMFLIRVENGALPRIQPINEIVHRPPQEEVVVGVWVDVHYASKMDFIQPFLCQGRAERFTSKRDPIGAAFAGIWYSVIPNLTTVDVFADTFESEASPGVVCRNGENEDAGAVKIAAKLYFEIQASVAIWQAHFHFNNTMLAPRFLSCGERPVNELPFFELVDVFEVGVWASLGVTTVAVVLLLTKISRPLHHSSIGLVKVFLEQGGPFPDSWFAPRSVTSRLCLLVMLMGIVVSNAYKNVNVYNMIAPRIPIPYKLFDQLHADNFTVYTRGYIKDYDAQQLLKIVRPSGDLDTRGVVVYDNFEFSEIKMMPDGWGKLVEGKESIAKVSSEMEYWNDLDPRELQGNKDKLDAIIARTVVHPFPGQEFLGEVAKQPEGEELFQEWALNSSLKTLRECNRTAVILPYRDCMKALRKMLAARFINVNVGEENYFEFSGMVSMAGYWPRFVVERIKLAKGEAGICHRWMSIVLSSVYANVEAQWVGNPVKSPTMAGNILVIFAVLGAGLAGAVLSFVGETTFQTGRWELVTRVIGRMLIIGGRGKIKTVLTGFVQKIINNGRGIQKGEFLAPIRVTQVMPQNGGVSTPQSESNGEHVYGYK